MDTMKTPKGTELPLIKLKGKDYLQVAHRLIWFNEVAARFSVDTSFSLLTDEQTIAHAKISMYDETGQLLKSATATKRETKKDFPDHTEKAETGALGRCLAELGFGTQFALAELDEGDRIVDSPVVNVRELKSAPKAVEQEAKKAPSYKKEEPKLAPVAEKKKEEYAW